jgi:signal transduction histidine kinase
LCFLRRQYGEIYSGVSMPHEESQELIRHVSAQGWAARLSDVWDVGLIVLGSDEQIDFINTRAKALLGAPGRDIGERWRPVKRQIDPALATARRIKGEGPLEVQAATVESARPNLRVQVFLVEEDECVGFLLLLQHVDRAAAIERALCDAARSRSLRSLFGDTAHNIKDVLNVISMNVELLSRAALNGPADAGGGKRASRYADVVRREMGLLERSIDALLDRHVEEREAPQTFDINGICEMILVLIAARASRQRVEVRWTSSEHPADVRGFPDRMHAALLSLITNALDAMPDGGTLKLSVAKATTIQVRVCDSGPGIASDRLPDIWRLHFSTKPLGTGLGLYVTRSVVEAHGGTIRHEPNSDRGSCFIIELPSA